MTLPVDVGEETGKQDQMLDKIADVYDEEVQTLVDSMVSLMEPVMVIVLGLIVGFIVISLFMPMIGIIGFDYAYGFDNYDVTTGKYFGQWKPHFVFGKSF